MPKIYSPALDQSIDINRIIGSYEGTASGPTLIFTAGIHGNEPAGVFALKHLLDFLKNGAYPIKGNLYAISGNLGALEKGVRYFELDLNRQWTHQSLQELSDGSFTVNNQEQQEQQELYHTIRNIMDSNKGPHYFFDLHTTSSDTIPFITVNDSLLNRKYTQQYPVPMILGIEEYLEGPLLSYINELGYVAFGFEGGQHDTKESISNHFAFSLLSLVYAGSLDASEIDFEKYYRVLQKSTHNSKTIYEITSRYEIRPFEQFDMHSGFVNFQAITKGQHIATSNGKDIFGERNGKIFMPLYQGKGNDGFFEIRRVRKYFLTISALLRKIKFDRILPLLPGVTWSSSKKQALMVNMKITRFFPKQFFHLLGYRNKQVDKTHLRIKNREATSRKKEYKEAKWY